MNCAISGMEHTDIKKKQPIKQHFFSIIVVEGSMNELLN